MAEATLPTKEEIATLPRWARVALVARCARRVLPYFQRSWPAAPIEYVTSVEKAVVLAEHAASVATRVVGFIPIPGSHIGRGVPADAKVKEVAIAASVAAQPIATLTAQVAASAARAAFSDDAEEYTFAVDTAATIGVSTEHLSTDFQLLLAASRDGRWDDSTPVPPSVFGPLGPDAAQSSAGNTFTFDVEIPDHIPDEDAVNWVRRLAGLLSDQHIAGGGHGLAVVPPIEITADVDCLVPAGGPTR